MRRSIVLLVAIAAVSLSSAAEGQLIYVAFKSPKIEKRFKDSITVFKGQNVLIGEPLEGITVTGTNINFTTGLRPALSAWCSPECRLGAVDLDDVRD